MRRGFGWGAAILVVLLVIGVAIGAYNVGLDEGLQQSGNVEVVRYVGGHGFGFFPFFLFFPLFFLALFAFKGAMWRRHGQGHNGHGPGSGWHRPGRPQRLGAGIRGVAPPPARERRRHQRRGRTLERLRSGTRDGGGHGCHRPASAALFGRRSRPMKTVLVVEDEMKIARVVRDYLTDAGFEVIVASSGEAAIASARGARPDLVVLDLGLPGIDGLDVARELRGSSQVPIVMLTARGEETDRIVGLELGADDYVVKPFSPKELVARVRAVLRRTSTAEMLREHPIRVADVEIDPQRMRVTVDGRAVELTPTEFQLLAALAREPGRVFTRGQLLDAIHGVAIESYERAIDAHVKNIRKKLEPEPGTPRYVLTVHGVGYRFADD